MSGQKFQYDESGGTFFYFLLSFLALLLVPGTYYLWPRCPKQDPDQLAKECQCDGCKKKKVILQANKPWKETKALFTKFLIILGWAILILLAYKVSQFDYEMANFDPYEILSIPPGSSQGEIKKAYRKLSLILHPDKETGNEKAFMKLTKAYQALTDDEARKNWEKYGNPDGPGAMSFGIALPSWIVEKENSVWVLGLYALVFMVALPTVVGMWWYKSIRYTGDQVLLTTTEMYYFFFVKTPTMSLKRVIMILAASFEFFKKRNAEIVERHSDSEEVPSLIKQLPNLGEKNKEVPLCHLYSIKARALLHAHLSRIPLNPETLDKDRQYIVKKCPYLIQEMVACVHQVILLAYARRVPRVPTITTIENCMKLCPMIVQGFWEFKNPLLQLPHITEDNLKYFHAKKRQIKSLQQFAQLKGEERRLILRNLSDSQYEDVMKVLGNMPYIDFKVRSEVIDDENPTVYTAGAIVTVTVSLTRKDMKHLFGNDSVNERTIIDDNKGGEAIEEASEEQNQSTKTAKPAWLKQKKGQKKSHKKGTNKKLAPAKNTQAQSQAVANNTQHSNTPNARKKDDKTEKESSKEKLSDVRWKMRRPTDELVMDLDDPLRADIVRAIGVTKLQYEPTIGHKFLAGMENGMVIKVRRKLANPVDKLAMRFNCHVGPVIAIDRSPFATKNFLTVGDWTVKIWTEDTAREGSLLTIREQNTDLRGGCWSRSRYSVFFTINATGLLEVYDILNGVDSPVTTFRVCNDSLTAIAPHENGQLLAVGSHDGNIYLVECSEGLIVNTKTDKANLTAYLESCGRFEKTVDTRLKEIRLMQAGVHEDSTADHLTFVSKNRHKKGNNKEKNKNRAQVKEKVEHSTKKSRMRKLEKDDTFFEELTESEAAFFQTVKRELENYSRLDPETEEMISLMQETPRKKKIIAREPVTVENKIAKIAPKQHKFVREERTSAARPKSSRSLIEEIEVDKEEDGERAVTTLEAPFAKPRKTVKIVKKRRGEEILSKVCAVEVCKPEICCADLEEERKAELKTQLASEEKEPPWVITQRRRKLFDLEQKFPEHSSIGKRKILLEDESLADVLADEVEEARREMRAWQERIALSKRDFWRSQTIEVVHGKPEEKKKRAGNGDVESPVRGVVEMGRSNFRQLAETRSKWKSAIEDETLRAHEERKERKLELHLEKCVQEEETHPTLSAYTDESMKTITVTPATKREYRGSDQ